MEIFPMTIYNEYIICTYSRQITAAHIYLYVCGSL